jgi:hypothetical protein
VSALSRWDSVRQPQPIKARPIALIVNRGIPRLGDQANVFLVVLVLTLIITQNLQPVKSVLQESMRSIQDKRLAKSCNDDPDCKIGDTTLKTELHGDPLCSFDPEYYLE